MGLPTSQATNFSSFPMEIRLKIWGQVEADGPQIIELRWNEVQRAAPLESEIEREAFLRKAAIQRRYPFLATTNLPLPITFHINRESRQVGLQTYNKITTLWKPSRIYYHPQYNKYYINSFRHMLSMFISLPSHHDGMSYAEALAEIPALIMHEWKDPQIDTQLTLKFLSKLPDLEKLTLISHRAGCQYAFEWKFGINDENVKLVPETYKDYARVKTEEWNRIMDAHQAQNPGSKRVELKLQCMEIGGIRCCYHLTKPHGIDG